MLVSLFIQKTCVRVATEEKRTGPDLKVECCVLKIRKNQIKKHFHGRTQFGLTGFVHVIST